MSKTLAVFFAVFISVFSLLTFLSKPENFSETENRSLAKFPAISISTITSGSFEKDFELYLSDHFFLRSFFIKLKNSAERMLLKTEIGNTYIGKDGTYFQKKSISDVSLIKENVGVINNVAKRNPNKQVGFIAAYSRYTIYPELLNNNSPYPNEKSIMETIRENLKNVSVVDTIKTLTEHKDEYIYFSTDHHWTQRGAYYSYLAAAKKQANDFEIKSYPHFYGSLYSAAPRFGVDDDTLDIYCFKNHQLSVEYFDYGIVDDDVYRMQNVHSKDKYTVFLNGNNSFIKITNHLSHNGKQLLIFKDSFAHALIPFLVENYDAVYIADMRYINTSSSSFLNYMGVDMSSITDITFIYNLTWFADDENFKKIDT